ncbi:CorA family magnesium transporter [Aspergillus mulundensis]|uniref:Magnesium transporter n=1 Tax=Aspergillus mulundensis TaxID=1810919 RepID=A0A3D8QIG7_9EURO|nr:Uncharacterized protein DSM5745_10712 [Aspergillus mulundensis]RDW61214.1 Uncharacterized protein DSM5745_10712 [Aspergillus mulundensis]
MRPLCMAWGQFGVILPASCAGPRRVGAFGVDLVQSIWKRHVGGAQSIHTLTAPTGCRAENQSLFDLSLQLSQRPMDGNAMMQYTEYHRDDAMSRAGHATKLGVAEKYGLSSRDLRVFDQQSGSPHILVRDHTLLLHFFDLRVLVQHDHARLFHEASASDDDVQNADRHYVSRIFSHNMEDNIRGQELGKSDSQPYELYVLETALSSVTSVLEAEYMLLEKQVTKVLRLANSSTLDGEESLIHSHLRTILELKRKLISVEQRALQVQTVAQEVLDEDEDMANMYLTDKRAGKPHGLEEHQSVEYLFEAYFKASGAIGQETASLMSHIRRTEETIQYTLSVRRNQIMVLEARIEILMLALAGATLVAGWYGMNLVNHSEESPHAFTVVVLISCAAVLASSLYGMQRLRRIRRARLQI